MTDRLWQITAPHFCCGLVVKDGIVTDSAPIVKWAVGKQWSEVRSYMKRKGWNGVPIND